MTNTLLSSWLTNLAMAHCHAATYATRAGARKLFRTFLRSVFAHVCLLHAHMLVFIAFDTVCTLHDTLNVHFCINFLHFLHGVPIVSLYLLFAYLVCRL